MQPSWYSFSSWPHIDIIPLGRSITCTFLATFFYSRDVFGIEYIKFFWSIHVGSSATQNVCDKYNKFVIDHLKIATGFWKITHMGANDTVNI